MDDTSRGVSLILAALVLAAAVVVFYFRYSNLGDLSMLRKIGESSVWGIGVVVLGFVCMHSAEVLFAPGSGVGSTSDVEDEQSSMPVRPDELSNFEAELPEMAAPELEGIKGKPPEELANALRKLSEGGET